MADLNKRLKQLRLEKGYTQEEIAEQIGLTRQAISSYESGRTQPGIDILMQFAEIYDVELNEIVQEPASKKKKHNYVHLISLIVLLLWIIFELINIILLAVAEHSFPINIHGELGENDMYFRLSALSASFDQGALNIFLDGSVIFIILNLFTKEPALFKRKLKYFGIFIAAALIIIMISYILIPKWAVNTLVTVRFSIFILFAVFIIDTILQWLKQKIRRSA